METEIKIRHIMLLGFLIMTIVGCAGNESLFGQQDPLLAITTTKTEVLKARKWDVDKCAPIEIRRAQDLLSEAEDIWGVKGDLEDKGNLRERREANPDGHNSSYDAIREKTLLAMLNAQLSQAKCAIKQAEATLNDTQIEKLKAENIKKQYEADLIQTQNILIKQQKLEAERREAQARAEADRKAREEALKLKEEAEAANKAAQLQMELAEAARLKAMQEAQVSELARLEAVKLREQADLARLSSEKQQAEAEAARQKAMQEADAERAKADAERKAREEALKQKDQAEADKLAALKQAELAQKERLEMQDKLKGLASEFARVRQEKRGLVISLSDILFDIDKATIQPGIAKNLEALAKILGEYPDHKIQIEGHTDSTGSDEHNQLLSERRAIAVKNFLANRSINPQQIESYGYGKTRPVATNNTPEGRQQNRRVDIIILNKGESIQANSAPQS